MRDLDIFSDNDLKNELERRERLEIISRTIEIINNQINNLRDNGVEIYSHLEGNNFILNAIHYNPYLDKVVYLEE